MPLLANAQSLPSPPPGKPATEATKRANAALAKSLDFNDKQDFEDAERGLIARPDTLTIKGEEGNVVWDMEQYKTYIGDNKPAPDTVNPSLWRNAQLNMHYGLYKVSDRIYQVRGYDLSNITFIQGDTGWIVGDPLSNVETAKAAYDLVTEHLGKRPIVALIYSHSHGDHYGGARGIVDEADVKSGKVKVLAPEHFTEEAVSEFVIAGNAMGRRGMYMYGPLLPRTPTGGVNAGLGQAIPLGRASLILPTDSITKSGETRTIDGVKLVFQLTPGTEAPAEMNVFLPQFKAMWMAENATHTLHNLLTLRGAQVRNGLIWAKFLDETIDEYGPQIDTEFASHHWPMWGNQRIVKFLGDQRDLYKYIHDQSVNLMNKGYTGTEIADMIQLPPSLAKAWYSRGYYGTVKHDSRAVYQRYMGFYDGNPSTLDQLPPEPAAKKYVEYMGGSAAVLQKAKADYDKGEYRWVAEAVKQVVFADPNNAEAKNLLADTYEQLGYQAEAGTWRSIYLMGAHELRNGVPKAPALDLTGPDTIAAMPPDQLFSYWGVRMNGPKAAGKDMTLGFDFADLRKQYTLMVRNGALTTESKAAAKPDAQLTMNKAVLDRIQLGQTTIDEAIASGDIKVQGDKGKVKTFFSLLDVYPFWFNIVTP
ncbi:alkyl/aryl-sulfatase [Lysobacter arvi]|nr:alkyl sulfatase dimerization domain-containing protein [Lysobacter arvi]